MQKITIKHKRRIFKVKTSGCPHRSAQTMSWTLSFFMNLSEPFNPQLKPKPSGKPLAVTVMPSR
jgi:hypothetical protein